MSAKRLRRAASVKRWSLVRSKLCSAGAHASRVRAPRSSSRPRHRRTTRCAPVSGRRVIRADVVVGRRTHREVCIVASESDPYSSVSPGCTSSAVAMDEYAMASPSARVDVAGWMPALQRRRCPTRNTRPVSSCISAHATPTRGRSSGMMSCAWESCSVAAKCTSRAMLEGKTAPHTQ